MTLRKSLSGNLRDFRKLPENPRNCLRKSVAEVCGSLRSHLSKTTGNTCGSLRNCCGSYPPSKEGDFRAALIEGWAARTLEKEITEWTKISTPWSASWSSSTGLHPLCHQSQVSGSLRSTLRTSPVNHPLLGLIAFSIGEVVSTTRLGASAPRLRQSVAARSWTRFTAHSSNRSTPGVRSGSIIVGADLAQVGTHKPETFAIAGWLP